MHWKKTTQKLLRDEAQYQRQAENLTSSRNHLDQQQRHLLAQRNLLQLQFEQLMLRRNQPGLSAHQRQQLQQEFNELQFRSERFQREAEYLQQQQLSLILRLPPTKAVFSLTTIILIRHSSAFHHASSIKEFLKAMKSISISLMRKMTCV